MTHFCRNVSNVSISHTFLVPALFLVAAAVATCFTAPRLDGAVAFFVALALGTATFLATVGAAFLVGSEFSFEADVKGFALGASLILPDGPLGSIKMPASVPLVIARFSWDRLSPDTSILYASSAYFLMVFRETPRRISSVLAAMHYLMISFQLGRLRIVVALALGFAFEASFFLGCLEVEAGAEVIETDMITDECTHTVQLLSIYILRVLLYQRLCRIYSLLID